MTTEPEYPYNTTGHEYNNPTLAAQIILDGHIVSWAPGNGGRYEIGIASMRGGKRFLLCANVEWFVPLGDIIKPHPVTWWVDHLPRGEWAGLRPLLLALGMTFGDPAKDLVFRFDDAQREAEARIGHEDYAKHGGAIHKDRAMAQDRRLGQLVRSTLGAAGLFIDQAKIDGVEVSPDRNPAS